MGPVGGRRFERSVELADRKQNAERRGKIACLTGSLTDSQLETSIKYYGVVIST